MNANKYIDYGKVLQLNELFIPKDPANRHYQQFSLECRNNAADVVVYKNPQDDWLEIRTRRNVLLADSDWSQLSDTALTEEQRAAWKTYRQALRDIPEAFSNPSSVVWPELPTAKS
jgi:hypothetical protein